MSLSSKANVRKKNKFKPITYNAKTHENFLEYNFIKKKHKLIKEYN